jgi:hypothetical protein
MSVSESYSALLPARGLAAFQPAGASAGTETRSDPLPKKGGNRGHGYTLVEWV